MLKELSKAKKAEKPDKTIKKTPEVLQEIKGIRCGGRYYNCFTTIEPEEDGGVDYGHGHVYQLIQGPEPRFEKCHEYRYDLVCIADRPGGDLVCMDKEDGSIWFWFHDVADDNLVMVADSFEEFICGFSYEEPASSNNDEPEISLSPEMDKLLRKKAQEYNK